MFSNSTKHNHYNSEQSKFVGQIAESVLEDSDENKKNSISADETPLKNFKIRDLLQIIGNLHFIIFYFDLILGLNKFLEDFINNEEQDIEKLLMRIKLFWKGTKAEPFLNKLAEYLISKFSPSQAIFKIMKKFG